MKKKMFVHFIVLISSFFHAEIQAQIKEGKVVYDRSMRVRSIGNESGGTDDANKGTYVLMFGENQSLWQYFPSPADLNPSSPGTTMYQISGTTDVIYFDFNNERQVHEIEFWGKPFLVSDTIKKLAWEITSEEKIILNYTVRKAVSERIDKRMKVGMENGRMLNEVIADTSIITACFAPSITIPAGPDDFQGSLPGLILN